MKKNILFIALITSSIFIISCSNKQTEQPVSKNINTQDNSNSPTEQLIPTPLNNNNISTPTPISESQDEITQGASAQKADNPDEFVSTLFSDTTDDYSYTIPKIDINSDYAITINKEIQEEYKTEVDDEINNYKKGYSVFLYSVEYDVFLNDTILSLVICREYPDDCIDYQVYNVDVSTGKSVSNTQLLQYKDITETDLLNKLPEVYSDEFINQNGTKETDIDNMKTAPCGFTEEEIKDFSKDYTDQYNMTIDISNYGIDTPMFLNADGNLIIIAKIYSLAGSDFYYQMINVDNSMNDLENNKDDIKTVDSDMPVQGTVSNLNNDITIENIKKIMLEANALLNKLYKGGNCSSEIIGSEDGTDVYGYTGSYNTFDKVKRLFGDYYSDNVIEEVLLRNGFINLFGTVGIIGADGDAYYNIEANSKIKMIINEDNKKIVEVEEFGETDEGVDTIYTQYTLEKQASGKWMITDSDPNYSYDEIKKQLYYNDKFSFTASSQKENYPPINASDGDLQTAWVEGVKGDGIGEWLGFEATNNYDVSGIKIINGYTKSDDLYYANNRIKKIRIELPDNTVIESQLINGTPDYQTIDFKKVVDVKNIRIIILEVYPGSKYHDTCISEIKVFR
jgi:hypothetical protein